MGPYVRGAHRLPTRNRAVVLTSSAAASLIAAEVNWFQQALGFKSIKSNNEPGDVGSLDRKAKTHLNYFNYFTEIEDAFIRRRGKHLLVSSIDWALIETWKEQGVPLHIALRGIEKAFDSWQSKPRKRSVKSLLYCQEEVEAQYAEWIESRVGAGTDQNPEGYEATDVSREDEGLPFPRQAIVEHLQRGRTALLGTFQQRTRAGADDLTDALLRAANMLEELERDFTHSARADAQKLEVSLTGLERMLSESIRSVIPTEQLNAAASEVKAQLRPYRGHMDKAAYEQTVDNLLQKKLKEQFAVPRLSLFYL